MDIKHQEAFEAVKQALKAKWTRRLFHAHFLSDITARQEPGAQLQHKQHAWRLHDASPCPFSPALYNPAGLHTSGRLIICPLIFSPCDFYARNHRKIPFGRCHNCGKNVNTVKSEINRGRKGRGAAARLPARTPYLVPFSADGATTYSVIHRNGG